MEIELRLRFKEDSDLLTLGDDPVLVTIQGIGPACFKIKNQLEKLCSVEDCQVRPQLIRKKHEV